MALVRLAHKASAVSVGKANRGPYERNQTGWPVPGREATAARKAPGGCFRSLFACSCRQRRPLQWHKWILSGNYFSGKAWVAMKSQGLRVLTQRLWENTYMWKISINLSETEADSRLQTGWIQRANQRKRQIMHT